MTRRVEVRGAPPHARQASVDDTSCRCPPAAVSVGGALLEKLCPAGVEAAALVAVVCRGKLTVATLVPPGLASAKSAAGQAARGEAMMRAWPVLMAVVREVLPRNTSAEDELLRISVNAFELAHRMRAPTPSHREPGGAGV